MRKSNKSRWCRRGAVDHGATVDIVSQLECAIRRPQAALIGALVGGLVPWFSRTLAHEQVPAIWSGNRLLALVMLVVVVGCAVFSGLSVYKFGLATFGASERGKALGFVAALEGVLLVSHGATSTVALVALIVINALGNGSSIALARDATCRRREADARGAATRARTRAEARASRVESAAPFAVPVVEVVVDPLPAQRAARPVRVPDHAVVAWSRRSHSAVIDVGQKLLA